MTKEVMRWARSSMFINHLDSLFCEVLSQMGCQYLKELSIVFVIDL